MVGVHQRTGRVTHFDRAKPPEDAKVFGDSITRIGDIAPANARIASRFAVGTLAQRTDTPATSTTEELDESEKDTFHRSAQ